VAFSGKNPGLAARPLTSEVEGGEEGRLERRKRKKRGRRRRLGPN